MGITTESAVLRANEVPRADCPKEPSWGGVAEALNPVYSAVIWVVNDDWAGLRGEQPGPVGHGGGLSGGLVRYGASGWGLAGWVALWVGVLEADRLIVLVADDGELLRPGA